MFERLIAPWPQERFTPTLSVSVPAPPGFPEPTPHDKRRAMDSIDTWLDRALRLPMMLSLNPQTVFSLDLAKLFRRTHRMVDGGVETTLQFQETFLPEELFVDLEPRLKRAFESLWIPRVLSLLANITGPDNEASLLSHLSAHHHESSLRSVLNRIASLVNDELHLRVRDGWETATAEVQGVMASSENIFSESC